MNEFNLEQQFAIDVAVNSNKHLFITGPAGAGKTKILKDIVAGCRQIRKNVVVAAPTGIAALTAGGVTLHSLFRLPFTPFSPKDEALSKANIWNTISIRGPQLDLIKSIQILIIDEASMIPNHIIDTIDKTLRYYRRNFDTPFGGVQVVFFGDLYQLPPVLKEWEMLKKFYKSPYFFSAKIIRKLISNNEFGIIALSKVYRQKDQDFIDLLNRCRIGKHTKADVKFLNKKFDPTFTMMDDPEYVQICTHNATVDQINRQTLESNPNAPVIYRGKIEGTFPRKRGKPDATVDEVLTLKIGLPVMVMANSTPSGIYTNGQTGVVKTLLKDRVVVTIKERDIEIFPAKWVSYKYRVVDSSPKLGEKPEDFEKRKKKKSIKSQLKGSFEQIPLRISSAATVHKVQGLSIEKISLDISKCFATGQAYTALSRGMSPDNMVLLKKVKKSHIFTDPIIEKFSAFKLKKKFMRKYFKKKFGADWKTKLIEQNEKCNL